MKQLDAETYFAAVSSKALRTRQAQEVMFELTYGCNLRCVHCYLGPQEQHWADASRRQELGLEKLLGHAQMGQVDRIERAAEHADAAGPGRGTNPGPTRGSGRRHAPGTCTS